jgi:hypothetical protein
VESFSKIAEYVMMLKAKSQSIIRLMEFGTFLLFGPGNTELINVSKGKKSANLTGYHSEIQATLWVKVLE